MTNSEKFKGVFGLYATELWAMPEKDLLNWINTEYKESESAQPEIVRCKDCRYVWNEDGWDNLWCNRLTGSFSVEKDGGCSWGKI